MKKYHDYYDNRELSWLKFNERVLEEASDSSVPLGERLNFAAIFQSNLDDFFMIRVGSLRECIFATDKVGNKPDDKTGLTAAEQLELIYTRVADLTLTRDASYFAIMNALHNAYGVEQVDFRSLSKKEEERLRGIFENEILPCVTPQVITKGDPFPNPQNKGIYAVAHIESKNGVKIGLIQASGPFKRVIYIPTEGKLRFMLVEELILHFMPRVFSKEKILSKSLMRITRNADINLEEAMYDHDIDYREIMSSLLQNRRKLAAVRMELSRNLSEPAVEFLRKNLKMTASQIFYIKSPLDMSFVYTLRDEIEPILPDIYYPQYIPKQPQMIDKSRPIMEQARERDLLLSYPYESIRPFLQLLSEAAADKDVVSIKITLYRVATNSKVVGALINAAENGKNVVVLVELRARFDEENNIGWSKSLEEAGCTVIYGLEGLKVHSKLLLITRKSGDTVEYITQIGTGNYHEKTAALYTDLSLITSNRDIATDARHVFTCLSIGNPEIKTDFLIAAPLGLQRKIAELIDRQISRAKDGKSAYIGLKMNSLTDKILIKKLVEASKAGVRIDMAIRGISCLVANVPEYTENIKIISIVGRFLEHSRIYIFGDPDDTENNPDVYISSADFMTRNTTRRIEIAAPIFDKEIRKRIIEIFKLMFADNIKARVMQPDGRYIRRPLYPNEQPLSIQETLMKQAEAASEKTATTVHVKKIKRKKPHAD
jgi:polyphosphate kinase